MSLFQCVNENVLSYIQINRTDNRFGTKSLAIWQHCRSIVNHMADNLVSIVLAGYRIWYGRILQMARA